MTWDEVLSEYKPEDRAAVAREWQNLGMEPADYVEFGGDLGWARDVSELGVEADYVAEEDLW